MLTWVAFNSRFDFGYLANLVDQAPLPFSENLFIQRCSDYFPTFFDDKQLRDDKGSLKEQLVSEKLSLPMFAHQSGSDSLSTLKLFFKSIEQLKAKDRQIDIDASKNHIYFIQQEFNESEYGDRNDTIFGNDAQGYYELN